MLFNSNVFFLFLAGFAFGFYLVRNCLELRNRLIVAASFLFYGWWDYRFLFLLIASSCLDFWVAQKIEDSPDPVVRRRWLWLSIGVAASLIGFFKYYGFFIESLNSAFSGVGIPLSLPVLKVVLPVGISFYTFQTMSYVVDVYRKEIRASRDLTPFLAFVSFFPQLVAGPIERAGRLLPQFQVPRTLEIGRVHEGTWLMIWGLFKKVVIADNMAPLVETAFAHPTPGVELVLGGVLAFAFQIYGDFSGYSDMARGMAKWFGFDLTFNFELPYFATNLREFWRRWHVSLSQWLRDYVFIPMGGSRGGEFRTGRNLVFTFLLGGLWHGAAWNFVLWGAWHGLGLVLHRVLSRAARNLPAALSWCITMAWVGYGWLLFRATSWDQVASMTLQLLQPTVWVGMSDFWRVFLAFSVPLVAMESWMKYRKNLLQVLTWNPWKRGLLEGALLYSIVYFWKRDTPPFIYFQF